MNRYEMHAANIRVFMPTNNRNRNKRARGKQPRDPECLANYSHSTIFNYGRIGVYK